MARDLLDLEHDRKVLAGECDDDTLFFHRECPCPDPRLCRFEGRVCTTCGKMERPADFTLRLQSLRKWQRGGFPLGRSDLSAAQWEGLGRLAALEVKPWTF